MKVTTRFAVGGVEYTIDIDDDNAMQALHEAIALANPRDTCNVCGEVGLDSKRMETIKTKGDGYIYIRVLCSCGARSTLGQYKTDGFFWHAYEVYDPDGQGGQPDVPTQPSQQPAQRPPGPEGAPGWGWNDDPSGDRSPASEQQVTAILRIATGRGFDGAAETMAYASNLLERPLNELGELSSAEAAELIKALQQL